MPYTLEYSRNARKDIRAIRDRTLKARLERTLLALREEPRPSGMKLVKGYQGILRVRVGDWPICYRIEDDRVVMVVVTIAPRGEVYERLGRRQG